MTLLVISGGSVGQTAEVNHTITPPVAAIPESATVIYVNPATGRDSNDAGKTEATPYKTITYALNQAQDNNTVIQLAAGSYTKDTGEIFPLDIKSGVTLRGTPSTQGQTTIIIGSGSYSSPTFASQNITVQAENNSIITGVTITNPNTRGTALWIESTNPTVESNTFTNSNREGIFITGTGNPKITDNIFIKNGGNGISVVANAKGEIRHNVFQNTGFGLAIGGKSAPLVVDNQITENQDGLFINDSAQPTLRNNVIQSNKRDGVVITINAQPDLGTADSNGSNTIRNNGRYDLNNATRNTIVAIGNDVDRKHVVGQFQFIVPGQVAFNDVPQSYWAQPYIAALASKNIIAGFPDGTFKPDDLVTRAQFAAIIAKAFSPPAKRANQGFTDVSQSFWAYQAIQSAYRGNFISGYPDRTFRPQEQISRVQVLVSLSSGLGLASNDTSVLSAKYADASQIPTYATDAIAAATQQQLVINYPTLNQLNPNRQATRAEVAAFIYQALVNAKKADPIPSPYLVKVP